jgi:hypothetical protein
VSVGAVSAGPLGRHREQLVVGLVVSGIVLVTLLPYLYGYFSCPAEKRFLGLVGQNGGDQAFYLGWGAKQAENGHILFEDKYNGHADRRLVFNALWLVMGVSARWLGVSVLTVFHAERVVFSVLLLLSLYSLIRRFLETTRWRLLTLALAGLSSGFGVFRIPWQAWASPEGIRAVSPQTWTPDLWIVESNLLLTMLWEVVLPCATFLFFAVLSSAHSLLFLQRGSAWRTGLLALLLGSVYPYAVVSVYAILGGCALACVLLGRPFRKTLREYTTVCLVALPVVLWDGYLVWTDPRLTTGQVNYASPDLGEYLVGFGVLGVGSLVGAALAIWRRSRVHDFLLVWVAVTFVQIYLPLEWVPFQMQLILGVQAPLAILTVYALSSGWAALRGSHRAPARALWGAVLTATCLAALPTSLYHLANVFRGLDRRSLPEYIDRDLADAIDWLDGHADESAVVVSSPQVAPYIPVLANTRMYAGDYEAPTADFQAKLQRIRWLFERQQPKSDAAIVAFLRANRIEYLFYDRALAALGGEDVPRQLERIPELRLVFRNEAARIYRLRP